MVKKFNTYPGTFKIEVVETKKEQGLSLRETRDRFGIRATRTVLEWERIYDGQGAQALLIETRGCKGRPKNLGAKGEETLQQELERLRMENEYLKKLNALVREKEKQARKKKRK